MVPLLFICNAADLCPYLILVIHREICSAVTGGPVGAYLSAMLSETVHLRHSKAIFHLPLLISSQQAPLYHQHTAAGNLSVKFQQMYSLFLCVWILTVSRLARRAGKVKVFQCLPLTQKIPLSYHFADTKQFLRISADSSRPSFS